jgi:VanZ family protein
MAAGVLVASSWPSLSVQPFGLSVSDKLQHFGVYMLLAYLAYRGWVSRQSGPRSGRAKLLILLFLALFAALDEYHQRWIPGRTVEWGDFAANTAGVAFGFLCGAWHNRRQRRAFSTAPSTPPDKPRGLGPS